MFTYENGILIALIMWAWGFISIIIRSNSLFSKNLRKVGKRISWFDLSIIDITHQDAQRTNTKRILLFVFWWIILPLPFVLTSWAYVLIALAMLVYRVSKDFGVPVSVKEFRWKLRNTDMDFDQIVKELMILSDQNLSELEVTKQSLRQSIRDRQLN